MSPCLMSLLSLYVPSSNIRLIVEARTDETESRLGQVRPLEDGVEDVLSFTVQLVHLVQNQQPEDQRQTESEF